ncbi:MAG TPA: ACP S-malonyltransferase [Ktedonobacterales bacterium]|nr:ACP S-malonyltransferase [Ktedonobacterales bacterium]
MSQRVAFVFPGQGSQTVGMGADIFQASPAARSVYEIADDALGFPLSTLCFEGPESALRETVNTQPAIVATSLALLAALQEAAGAELGGESILRGPIQPAFVAGHSVGEYSAVAASGALDVADTLRLVRERGRLMHEEGLHCPSGMAAVLGVDADALTSICAEATDKTRASLSVDQLAEHPGAGRVVVANINAPGQIVISGATPALEAAMELARAAGAKRVVPLAVSGAFHSPVMAPAAEALATAVEAAPVTAPGVPIVANSTAEPLTSEAQLRGELAQQIVSPVQWTRTVEYLADHGVETFVEIGVGQVLAGLIRRIAKGATIVSVGAVADLASAVERLRA